MPITPVDTYTNAKLEPLPGYEHVEDAVAFMPNLTIARGTVLGQVTAANSAEIQTINYAADVAGGTYTLTIEDANDTGVTHTTAALAWNISNANLKIAIDALLATAGYAGAVVTIGGGASPVDCTVTFGGTAANWDMPLMVATSSLVTAALAPTTVTVDATQAGNRAGLWGPYNDALADGREVARAIAAYDFRTDHLGRVAYAGANEAPQHGAYEPTSSAWFKGAFQTTQLIGLDANGVADLGRIIKGALANGVLLI
jgi:hypothetical protein